MTKVLKQRLSSVAFGVALVTLGMALAPSSASAAVPAYLFVSGVPGPSTSRLGAIDALSFSFGVASGRKNLCSDLAVMKVLDETSPMLAAGVGQTFSEVRLEYDKPVGSAQVTYYVLKLVNVQITSVQQSGSNENHRLVVSEMHDQMLGRLSTDRRKWPKWVHPVANLGTVTSFARKVPPDVCAGCRKKMAVLNSALPGAETWCCVRRQISQEHGCA